MPLVLSIALTHLRARTRQSLVSLLGVATGVGFSIAMAALMQGSQLDFINKIIDATPHITIKDEFREADEQPAERRFATGAVAVEGAKPTEEVRGIKGARQKLAQLEELPDLAVSPVLRGQVVIRYFGKDEAAAIAGIEPERHVRVSQLAEDIREGRLEDLHTAANGLVMGDGLARKLAVKLGDTVTVSSPVGVVFKMKVVALFHTGVISLDEGEVYALLKKVQVLQDRPNVINRLLVKTGDVYGAFAQAREFEARFGYRAESWDEANQDILEALQIRNVIMYTVVAAILLVAGMGIFNVVSTITFEKLRDIAILKSIGFSERDIRWIFVLQGLIAGSVGSILGWGLGFGLCRIMSNIEFKVRFATEITQLPLYYSPWHYAIATVFAMTAAGLAAYFPARRAARVDPVDIIRGAA
jgi:lipoprotein-releasing system permease protein